MPEKEGSDDEKTTKGVVKKKQKQMMGEEGYDTYRDNILMRGGDHRSKETKEKSYTPSKQPKGQTVAQKAAKGKSALDPVKADITKKYGKGAIMDVKKKSKKKANVQDEFDLTKIAEAFGGYIIESEIDPKTGNIIARKGEAEKTEKLIKKEKKKLENPEIRAKQQAKKDIGPGFKSGAYSGDIGIDDNPNIIKPSKVKVTKDPKLIDPKFAAAKKAKETKAMKATRAAAEKQFVDTSTKALTDIEKDTSSLGGAEPETKREVRKLQKQQRTKSPIANRFFKDLSDKEALAIAAKEKDVKGFVDKEGKPAPKKLKPATRRKSTFTPPAFATRKGESGQPLPVSMRNRRVPKTSSIVPAETSAVTTTQTQAEPSIFQRIKQLRGTTTKGSLPPGIETVNPEVMGGDAEKFTQMQRTPKQGEVIDTTATEVEPNALKGSKSKRKNLLEPPKGVDPYELLKLRPQKDRVTVDTESEPEKGREGESETIKSNPTDQSGSKSSRKPPRVTTGRGGGKGKPFKSFATSLVKLAKDNPALSLIGYDQLKSLQNPFALKGGRAGLRSAAR